jgi:hypothetical protein
MLRTRVKERQSVSFRLALEKRIWDGDMIAEIGESEGLALLWFPKGLMEDVLELGELIVRRFAYEPTDKLRTPDEFWIDLVSEGVEIEVGWNAERKLYVIGPMAELERIVEALKIRFKETE